MYRYSLYTSSLSTGLFLSWFVVTLRKADLALADVLWTAFSPLERRLCRGVSGWSPLGLERRRSPGRSITPVGQQRVVCMAESCVVVSGGVSSQSERSDCVACSVVVVTACVLGAGSLDLSMHSVAGGLRLSFRPLRW